MRTFDWALFELYNEGQISYEDAIRNADSANELRLNIKLKSKRGEPNSMASSSLSFDRSTPAEMDAARQQELEQQKINQWKRDKEQQKTTTRG
jgi:twitching motility protein PilU